MKNLLKMVIINSLIYGALWYVFFYTLKGYNKTNMMYLLLGLGTFLTYCLIPFLKKILFPLLTIFIFFPFFTKKINYLAKVNNWEMNSILKIIIASTISAGIIFSVKFLLEFMDKTFDYYLEASLRNIKRGWKNLILKFRRRKMEKCHIDYTLKEIDNFGEGNTYFQGKLFEELIANIYKTMGYEAYTTGQLRELYKNGQSTGLGRLPPEVINSSGSGEQGVDVLVYIPQDNGKIKTLAIQCKHYNSNISNSAIQEISSALAIYQADQGCVITNSYFTKSARVNAKYNNILLIDRDHLEIILAKAVEKYYSNQKVKDKKDKIEKNSNVSELPKTTNDLKDEFWRRIG